MDEAGRGPLAGPVVACALTLHHRRFTVHLDDSKRLTPTARETAYQAILSAADIGVGLVESEEIDRIGITEATDRAMRQAIARLPRVPQLLLVDGNRVPLGCSVPAIPIVKGDAKSLVIACASIVAKVLRDRWMDRLHRFYPEYGFLRHKGYGTVEHMKVLSRIGPSRFHRYSFRPIRKEQVG